MSASPGQGRDTVEDRLDDVCILVDTELIRDGSGEEHVSLCDQLITSQSCSTSTSRSAASGILTKK